MITSKLAEEAVRFMDLQLELTQKVLPGRIYGDDADYNPADSSCTGTFSIPLSYGGSAIEPGVPCRDSDLYSMTVKYSFCADRTGTRLAVETSSYAINVSGKPAIRLEYDRRNTSAPMAHYHIHGLGGLLSPGLIRNASSKRGRSRTGNWQNLHLTNGGARYRPCYEEFLYFVVHECGFRHRAGCEELLVKGRDSWRRLQADPVVRDYPEVAAEVLRGLGYTVTAPDVVTSKPPHPCW